MQKEIWRIAKLTAAQAARRAPRYPCATAAANRAVARLSANARPAPNRFPGQIIAKLAAVLIALAGCAEPARAATAIECAAHKAPGAHSWREVDGRRCWYQGRRHLEKAALYWPEARQGAADREQAATEPPRPPAAPVAAQAEAGAVLVTIADRWPDTDWTEFYRGLISDAAVVAPAGRSQPSDVPIGGGKTKPAAMDRRHLPPSLLPTLVALAIGLVMMGAAMMVTSDRGA